MSVYVHIDRYFIFGQILILSLNNRYIEDRNYREDIKFVDEYIKINILAPRLFVVLGGLKWGS